MARNKQPWYHEVTITFTATDQLGQRDVEAAIAKGLKVLRDVVDGSVVIDCFEVEPGDPADLL